VNEAAASATRWQQLRSSSVGDAARLVWRKAVHRTVHMGRFGTPTSASTPPERPCELTIEVWGPDRFDDVLPNNPHLTVDDIEHFRRQQSRVIVITDGDRIPASSWMTNGSVYVHELQRHLEVPRTEHFSCRSYVDPDYAGRSLMSHMIHHYSTLQPDGDETWGLVYDWNVASVRSLERIGWRRSGDYWTSYWFGRKSGGERRYPPKPPTTI